MVGGWALRVLTPGRVCGGMVLGVGGCRVSSTASCRDGLVGGERVRERDRARWCLLRVVDRRGHTSHTFSHTLSHSRTISHILTHSHTQAEHVEEDPAKFYDLADFSQAPSPLLSLWQSGDEEIHHPCNAASRAAPATRGLSCLALSPLAPAAPQPPVPPLRLGCIGLQ